MAVGRTDGRHAGHLRDDPIRNGLQSRVAIAFFVPALVYLADGIGTQTEAITVRGLSLSNATVGTMIAGELRTGLIIGLTLGALTFPVIWLIFGDVRLALAVSLALLTAGICRDHHRLCVSLDILPSG